MTQQPQAASRSGPAGERAIDLDFVRGTAILLALGWHFNASKTGYAVLDWLMIPGRTIGWAGVDLFFVLSGFLIGGMIFREVKETDSFRVGRFLVRRALKIWPVLYGYLLLLLIVRRYPWQDFLVQNALHVQNFFRTPLSHLWSLAVEEHFYLILPALVLLLVRRRMARSLVLPVFLAATFGLCLLARLLAFFWGVDHVDVQWQTQYRIDALSAGALLAYVRTHRRDLFERMAARKAWLAGIWIVGAFFLASRFNDEFYVVVMRDTVAYVAGAAYLLFCYGAPALMKKPIWARAVAKVGLYSYAMYVYQFVAFRAMEALTREIHLPVLPIPVDIAMKYLGAFLVGYLVTRIVERPALALRDRIIPPAHAERPKTLSP